MVAKPTRDDGTGAIGAGSAAEGQRGWIERRSAFRGKALGRVLPVRFRAASHATWIHAETRDVGTGGAFLVSAVLAPVGTPVAIELALPTTDQTFVLQAIVRWAGPEGMGVQFVDVAGDVLLELTDYFSTLAVKP